MDSPRRILIIRPSALGDVCRSVPLAASLRRAFPAAQIEWLVNAPYADAVRGHPAVDRAVLFHRHRRGSVVTLLRRLAAARYDLVLDAQGLARSGLFSLATAAPVRVARRDAREGAWLAATRRAGARRGQGVSMHTVDAMLELLEPIGVEPVHDLRLTVPPDVPPDVEIEPNAVVLAPTSLWPGKRWPIERFAEIARRLLPDHPVVAVGGPGEREQCEPLLRVAGVIDRVGATSVGGLMSIVSRAAVVVANDSAALHMAVGLGVPRVALFGPTRTELVGPYGCARDVIQHIEPTDRLDHKHEAVGRSLMERISIDEVERAVRSRLHARVSDEPNPLAVAPLEVPQE